MAPKAALGERSAAVFLEESLNRQAAEIGQRGAEQIVAPIPPSKALQALGNLRWEARAQRGGGEAGHDHVGGNVFGDDRAAGNDSTGAYGHIRFDYGSMADPGVGANDGAAGVARFKKGLVIGRIVPVGAAAIQEVVQAGVLHRVVGGADPCHRGDVGEFAHRGVGDVGELVAVAVILKA